MRISDWSSDVCSSDLFGGIIAVNRPLDAATAAAVAALFAEVVIAPAVDDAAEAVLASKKNLRVLVTGGLPDPAAEGILITPLAGGFLAPSRAREIGRAVGGERGGPDRVAQGVPVAVKK